MNKLMTLVATAGLLLATNSEQALAQEPASIEGLTERLESLEQRVAKRERFDLSGYIQLYHMTGQEDAELFVGGKREAGTGTYSRIGVRRGRAKLTYNSGIATGVLQIDLTEKGVGFKDVYLQVMLPRLGQSFLRAGVFDRHFGHEITYSSSRRESPERSQVVRTLFPNERDLGLMLTLRPSKESSLSALRLDAALMAGHGIKPEVDSRLDFIARLSAQKALGSTLELSGGASLYYGSVLQPTAEVYKIQGSAFALDKNAGAAGSYVSRVYAGVDAQLSHFSAWGLTQLRGEWILGNQPGEASSHKSPNGALLTGPVYIRPFQGGYLTLVQDLGRSPLSAVVRYDWFDPNRKVSSGQLGTGGTTAADVAYSTLGVGLLWRISSSLRATAYGEIIRNETSAALSGYGVDRKDNRFTLALQYKL